MLDPKYYDLVIDDFNNVIQEERSQYFPILDLIKEYCSEYSSIIKPESEIIDGGKDQSKDKQKDQRIIIGGTMSVNMLLNLDSKKAYLLYSEAPLYHAIQLSNRINDFAISLDGWIVDMTTKIPHKHFEIRINNRSIAEINIISSGFENANVIQLINPIEVDNVLIMSPEFHLLYYYQKLYLPEYASDWESLMLEERRLFAHSKTHLIKFIEGKTRTITKNKTRSKIELELLNKFVKNNNKICLVGEYALKLLLSDADEPVIVKVISENSFSTDVAEIKKILIDFDPLIKMEYKIDTINVIGDYSLKRVSVKVTKNDNTYEVMYIYNSAYYELIPFTSHTNGDEFIQVGSSFVLLRFLLIDVWLIRRLIVGEKIHKEFGEMKIRSLLKNVVSLRTKISKPDTSSIDAKYYNSSEPGSIFQRSNYIGRYVNKIIQQKIKNLKNKVFIRDYYPQKHFNSFGVYKKI